MTQRLLDDSFGRLDSALGAKLPRQRVAEWEGMIRGADAGAVGTLLTAQAIDDGLLSAALEVKRRAGEINVVIHAVGILLTLPKILEPGEHVKSSSLGAGTGGHPYDLETDRRIAEFKFTTWRGHDAVRQRKLFADFVNLAEATDTRQRQLFVAHADLPRKFLYKSGRSIESVCSRRPETIDRIQQRHGTVPSSVSAYVRVYGAGVELVDLATILSVYTLDTLTSASSPTGMEDA